MQAAVSQPQPQTTTTLLAALYIRVSTSGQLDGYSPEVQERRMREYAAQQGWVVSETHVYYEAFTGTKLWERPKLREAKGAMRRGEFQVFLVFDPDRFSRNVNHTGVLADICERNHVQLAFCNFAYENTATGKFLLSLHAFRAEMEAERIADRTQSALEARVSEGKLLAGGKPRYGYRWRDLGTGKGQRKVGYDPDPETAPVVQRIFRAYAAGGVSLRALAERLNAEGVRGPKGGQWSRKTLGEMIADRRYLGEARALGLARGVDGTVPGYRAGAGKLLPDNAAMPEGAIARLVDDETFARAQTFLALNIATSRRNAKEPEGALLRGGQVYCGHCGWKLQTHGPTTVSRNGPTYRCHSRYEAGTTCPAPSIAASVLDEAGWSRAWTLLADETAVAHYLADLERDDPIADDLAELDARLATLDQRVANLIDTIGRLGSEAGTLVGVQLGRLAQERAGVLAERAPLAAQAAIRARIRARLAEVATYCAGLRAQARDLSYHDKRFILDALAVRVKVYKAGHSPRWEIRAALALPGEGEPEEVGGPGEVVEVVSPTDNGACGA